MSHLVKCHVCLAEMSMSEDIFARRIAGRKVSLKCRHCTATIIVDATAGGSATQQTTPVPPTTATSAPAAAAPIVKPTPAATVVAAPTPAPKETAKQATPRVPRATVTAKQPTEVAAKTAKQPTEAAKPPRVSPVAPAVRTAKAALPRLHGQTLLGMPAQPAPRQGPSRVRTPPPFPAVSVPPVPAVAAAPIHDDAQELSVVDMLPTDPPPAGATPVASPFESLDDVQDVSVVDLLPTDRPPAFVTQAAPIPVADAARAPSEPPVPLAARLTEPEPLPVASHAVPLQPEGPAAWTAEPVAPAISPVAIAAPASAFAKTMAYGSDIDLTPRAFALPDAPPSTEPVVQVIPEVPISRARPWRRRGVIAAVAITAIAGAALAVTRAGMLSGEASSKAAAARVEVKPAAPAAAVPRPKAAPAPVEAAPAPIAAAQARVEAASVQRDVAEAPPVEKAAIEPAPAALADPTPAAVAPSPAASPGPAPSRIAQRVLPAYVSEPGVLFLTRVAVQRAERTCHRRGRAVGKAQVFVTFTPNGRATDARVEGEPIASAPVARCIKDQLFSVIIPKFDGAAFTVSEPITLY